MKRATIMSVLATLAFLMLSEFAYARDPRWYAGKYRWNGYGVRADISTPASRPSMRLYDPNGDPSIVFHHVTNYGTDVPDEWTQAGWLLYGDRAYAQSYIEFPTGSGVFQEILSNQNWNFTRTYEVSYSYADAKWHIYIQSVEKHTGWFNGGVPDEIRVLSESTNTDNQFNTPFNNVKYRGVTTWFLFETNGQWAPNDVFYRHDDPFWITRSYPYRWTSYD